MSTAMILSSASSELDHAHAADRPASSRISPREIGRSVSTQTSIGSPSPRHLRSALDDVRSDARAAIGARHEAVERRAEIREALRSVDLQISRMLVDLVLDAVGRNHLDVGGDDLGETRPRIDPVPRMRAKRQRLARCAPSNIESGQGQSGVEDDGMRTGNGEPAYVTLRRRPARRPALVHQRRPM